MLTPDDNPCSTQVGSIMSSPVHTVQMDDFLYTAKGVFTTHRCHHVVVLDRTRVAGVVSDRDVLRALSPFVGNESMERSQDANTMRRRVHQIMSRKPVTMNSNDLVAAAAQRMLNEHVSSLPVLSKEGGLVGIITTRDILRWAVNACPVPENTALIEN